MDYKFRQRHCLLGRCVRQMSAQNAPRDFKQDNLQRGKDVVFVDERAKGDVNWSLYCVCDGHGGSEAAEFVKRRLADLLFEKLPRLKPNRKDGFTYWTSQIRVAITEALITIDEEFRLANSEAESGTTVTVALLAGWLLTIANLGDTEAVIDTGSRIEVMTCSHRLEDCEKERVRLSAAGVMLARLCKDLTGPADAGDVGLGPQRCWPGGLANSRAVGDLDGGEHIVARPYIKQVILPEGGCRVTMASDGLWDMMSRENACLVCRPNCTDSAAKRLVTLAIYSNGWVVHDDITVLVLDILSDQSFTQLCKSKRGTRNKFLCFCASEVKGEVDDRQCLIPIAEVDSAFDKITSAIDDSRLGIITRTNSTESSSD